MLTKAPRTFPKLFQRDIHLGRSIAILQITTKRLIQANPVQESVNRVKSAAQRERSVWEERHINDLVDVICSREYYKKLIFTNTKNSKNAEIYGNVLKELSHF